MRNPQHKITSLAGACQWRQALRGVDERAALVATNGCFDILHRGHVETLFAARRLGEALCVLVNSDASVQALKGPGRPRNRAADRAYVLAALRCVDCVVIFDGLRCADGLRSLAPDIYAKSEEYREKQDPLEAAALDACGARVEWLPMIGDYSSSSYLGGV